MTQKKLKKMKMHSIDLVQRNIEALQELFPNCITENRDENGEPCLAVDFDLLRQELSNTLVENGRERYQLDWPGKRKALLTANAPISKTLRPCREESVDFDTTQNLFIEGDNLEALKLLQDSYLGKVKMIYIDPPYNTGNDFVYKDRFAIDAQEYLRQSNQIDKEGNRLVTNPESNGRFHSDWLSMMYPRLKLARNLLRDDGAIFISIDDNEVANLRRICDEVFGQQNFVACITWHKKRGKDNSAKFFSVTHDFVLIYARNSNLFQIHRLGLDAETIQAYKNPDNDPRGPYRLLGLWSRQQGGSLYSYTMKSGKFFEERLWLVNKLTMTQLEDDDRLVVSQGNKLYRKLYLSENEGSIPETIWADCSNNANAKDELKSLFDKLPPFDTPKPVPFILKMARVASQPDDIILDFFSGSATTAHAVMQLNAEDGGNRRFILVQIPEICDEKSEAAKAGYKTIAEIGKERIRRAGKKIKDEMIAKQQQSGKSLIEESDAVDPETLDIGFRVLKIDSSSMEDVYYTPATFEQKKIANLASKVKKGRTAEDLLFHVMLDSGVDLSLPITKDTTSWKGRTVFFVQTNCLGLRPTLAVCFDEDIDEDFVMELAKRQPLRVVFFDHCFATDAERINAEHILKKLSPDTYDMKTI